MRCLLNLILIVVFLGAAALLGLGYLGLVPAVAGVFGSDRPRDLGVKFTQTELQSATEKARARIAALPATTPPSQSIKLSGSVPVNDSFTDRELTALIASHAGKWKYYPVTDAQVKINNDGTVETSGILRLDRIHEYAAATGVPSEVVDAVVDRLKLPNATPAFYVKGTVAVANGRVSGEIQQVEIGRLPIPSNLISENRGSITAFAEDRIRAAGISVKSVSFANGAMKFDGTVPESVGLSPGS